MNPEIGESSPRICVLTIFQVILKNIPDFSILLG
jgi:hypothetical protein